MVLINGEFYDSLCCTLIQGRLRRKVNVVCRVKQCTCRSQQIRLVSSAGIEGGNIPKITEI
jgi:hypothetical protein